LNFSTWPARLVPAPAAPLRTGTLPRIPTTGSVPARAVLRPAPTSALPGRSTLGSSSARWPHTTRASSRGTTPECSSRTIKTPPGGL